MRCFHVIYSEQQLKIKECFRNFCIKKTDFDIWVFYSEEQIKGCHGSQYSHSFNGTTKGKGKVKKNQWQLALTSQPARKATEKYKLLSNQINH